MYALCYTQVKVYGDVLTIYIPTEEEKAAEVRHKLLSLVHAIS